MSVYAKPKARGVGSSAGRWEKKSAAMKSYTGVGEEAEGLETPPSRGSLNLRGEREVGTAPRRAPRGLAHRGAQSRPGGTTGRPLRDDAGYAISHRRNNTRMEVSINMRVFKTIVLAIVLAAMSAEASPLLGFPRQELTASASEFKPTVDHYDQRQNGTENYRLKVDGLVFILAPADSLLLAGAGLDPNFSSIFSESDKPKPKPDKEDAKPKPDKEELIKPKQDKDNIPKSASNVESPVAQKPGLRITSLIAPFLNRIRQQHQQLQSEN